MKPENDMSTLSSSTEKDSASSVRALEELDGWIAENVMGWKALSGHDIPRNLVNFVNFSIEPHLEKVYIDRDGHIMACVQCGSVPSFSSEIADAWRVVERMRELKWHLIMNDTGSRYRARFFRLEDFDIDSWVRMPDMKLTIWADTAPLAICLAAKAALEAKL